MSARVRFHRKLDERDALVPVLVHDADGQVGLALPLRDEVVLSLRRLDAVSPVDGIAGQVTAGAGTMNSTAVNLRGVTFSRARSAVTW